MRRRLVLALLAHEGITVNAAQCKYTSEYCPDKFRVIFPQFFFCQKLKILAKNRIF